MNRKLGSQLWSLLMGGKIKKSAVKSSILLLICLVLSLFAFAYYDMVHRTATSIAVDLIRSIDRQRLYYEISYYKNEIADGSVEEDYGNVNGNHRSFRHFYDPDALGPKKGIRYYDWYLYWDWDRYTEVTPPASGFYDGALEWARNGAGSGDRYNWEGAIHAYGYTEQSRLEAYRRLGHVAHLIVDMAELDHVTLIPHPGSYRKMWVGITTLYGFEGLVEEHMPIFSPQKVRRYNDFDSYFNSMASFTKRFSQKYGFSSPLGLACVTSRFVLGSQIPWDPTINFTWEGTRYLEYAKRLIDLAIEHTSGLLIDFYDIVNQPPYVKFVDVSGKGGFYQGFWKDVEGMSASGCLDVIYREFVVDSRAFKVGNELNIEIAFGQDKAKIHEEIQEGSVTVTFSSRAETVTKNAVRTGESTWRVSYTPVLPPGFFEDEITLIINARDTQFHIKRLQLPERGYFLDSDPSTPARACYTPPYSWVGYETGADVLHKIKIEGEVEPQAEVDTQASSPAENFKVFIDTAYVVQSQMDDSEYIWTFYVDFQSAMESSLEVIGMEMLVECDTKDPALRWRYDNYLKQSDGSWEHRYQNKYGRPPYNQLQKEIVRTPHSVPDKFRKNSYTIIGNWPNVTSLQVLYRARDEGGKIFSSRDAVRRQEWAPDPATPHQYKRITKK